MSEKSNEKSAERSQRRVFFGQLFAAVGGGLLGGGVVQKLLGSRKQVREKERPVNISINPLAVPRSKEGSKSNV